MPGRQAPILTDTIIRRALAKLSHRPKAARDQVIFLLSLRAGLRACEIAGLEWSMVLNSNKQVGRTLVVHDRIAKKGGGRTIPLHPDLRVALQILRNQRSTPESPIIVSDRGGKLRANSLVNWFRELYREIDATGCSSHSGRRTFITKAARNAHKAGASLRDIQILAGHKSIEVTQGYIEGDTDAQRRLVALS
ncbi:site-specific integrase [Brevundimonas sp.]|uniref:tyrosine-type recombinase/integrase n=1 Tax=Brevundimonas sp. TaxID=1871086 RepID=UPI002FC58377